MILISIIGFIVAVFAIVMYFVHPKLDKNSPEILQIFDRSKTKILVSTGIAMFLFNWLFFYANQGYQYYLISPLGGKSAVFDQGFHWRGFARVQEWEKYVDIKSIGADETSEGIEGPIPNGIPIRFIDQVTADAFLYVRIQMPTDAVSFIQLAEEFKTPQNLVMNTLVPTIREQVINTGYMYAAEDYVSGNASNFRQDIDDQLKNGGFAVDKKEYKDTVINEIGQAVRQIREIKTRYEVKKRMDKNNKFIRIPHDINKNHLIISQVIVDKIDLEKKFRDKLEQQRDISANKRIELQKVETAAASQQRIIAEGERDKAKERVNRELEQVKVLIEIETQKKSEETKRELAEIALKTARLEAERTRVENDARAYANRQLVSAGLTPQQKAEYEMKTRIGIAEQLSKIQFPGVYIDGNNGKGSGMLETLLGADYAKKMLNKE